MDIKSKSVNSALIEQDESLYRCDSEVSRHFCYVLATSDKNGGFKIVQPDRKFSLHYFRCKRNYKII